MQSFTVKTTYLFATVLRMQQEVLFYLTKFLSQNILSLVRSEVSKLISNSIIAIDECGTFCWFELNELKFSVHLALNFEN